MAQGSVLSLRHVQLTFLEIRTAAASEEAAPVQHLTINLSLGTSPEYS